MRIGWICKDWSGSWNRCLEWARRPVGMPVPPPELSGGGDIASNVEVVADVHDDAEGEGVYIRRSPGDVEVINSYAECRISIPVCDTGETSILVCDDHSIFYMSRERGALDSS